MSEDREDFQLRRDFQLLMARVRGGCRDAAAELVQRYGDHIIRVVRRRLHRRLRSKFDSADFQQDVWASFFANSTETFAGPEALAKFLAEVAKNKVLMAVRKRLRLQKYNVDRENSLEGSAACQAADVPSPEPTPSQVAAAHEKWDQLLQGQPARYRRILALLRQGLTHEQIARELGLHEKTIQRLVRRLLPRAFS